MRYNKIASVVLPQATDYNTIVAIAMCVARFPPSSALFITVRLRVCESRALRRPCREVTRSGIHDVDVVECAKFVVGDEVLVVDLSGLAEFLVHVEPSTVAG